MKKIILSLLLVFISSPALSDSIQLKFGGWSKHTNTEFNYNENHNGIGIAYEHEKDFLFFNGIAAEAFTMTDSTNERQVQASVTAFKRFKLNGVPLHAIDLNLSTGVMNRGWWYDQDKDNNFYNTKKKTFAYMLPSLTMHLTKHIHADLVYIPKIKNINKANVFFVRGGISF